MAKSYQQLEKEYSAARQRIAELEQENERLRKASAFETIETDLMESYYVGKNEGMKRAAEIADRFKYTVAGEAVAKAIRAEIEK